MAAPSELPGIRRLAWVRNPALRFGVLTGVYLSLVMITWLVVANRMPWSEQFSGIRNALAAVVFGLVMLIPVCRFLRRPASLFASGITAWALLAFTYLVAGYFFHRLHSRKTPFEVLVLGALVYGVCAVVCWVATLVLAVRHEHHTVATARRR